MRRRFGVSVIRAVVLVCGAWLPSVHVQAQSQSPVPDSVSIQLKWTHQFQAAGFYAAIAKGLYRDAGVEVKLIEGNPERSVTEAVVNGDAEFGVSNSSLIIDRAKGHDVVVAAPIFQHSPFVMIARREHGIESVSDLAGRRVMVEADAAENLAYLRRAGLSLDDIVEVPHTGNPLALRDADIAGATAYTTTEPYDLISNRVPFQVFSPREFDIDFYGDTLFVNGELAQERPELVRAVRDATLQGWRYALAHTDEIIDLILTEYAPGLDRRKLEFEAEETKRLMIADIVDLGYVSVERWRHIADVFESVGMLEPGLDLDGFLFDADPPPPPYWAFATLAAAGGVILVLGWTSHRFYRMNRTLRTEVTHRRKLETRLLHLATTDALTGLPNRRFLFEFGEEAFRMARAGGNALSVLVLDIDRFKFINDTWGHAGGDAVLKAVATEMAEMIDGEGESGRLGGEEFAVVLPFADAAAATAYAEELRAALADVVVPRPGNAAISVTASVGAATLCPRDRSFDDLVVRADKGMYEAKQAGRNRIGSAEAA